MTDTITASDVIQRAKVDMLEVYGLSGNLRQRVKCTAQSETTLTIRDLRWYESAWFWLQGLDRRIFRYFTERIKNR